LRDPDWLRQAALAFWHEIRAFLAAAWSCARAPTTFSRRWADGELEALNPLACLLNSLALRGPWHVLWIHLLGVPNDMPFWIELGKPILPVLSLLFYGCGVHGLLRLTGKRRPLRTSLGVTMFVNAGPMTALALPVIPLNEAMLAGNSIGLAMSMANVVVLAVFALYLTVSLAAVHRVRRGWIVLAFVLVFVLWGALWFVLAQLMPAAIRPLLS
jgi:hypothetical protein